MNSYIDSTGIDNSRVTFIQIAAVCEQSGGRESEEALAAIGFLRSEVAFCLKGILFKDFRQGEKGVARRQIWVARRHLEKKIQYIY